MASFSILKAICLGVVLAIGALHIIFAPYYASSLEFEGKIANIQRDSHGIPHIQAPNRRTFLYAWGNVMAEDRLFQCTFRTLYASGRLSQFLGDRALKADIMMRDLGLKQISQTIAQNMKQNDPVAYSDFSAFVQGINDNVATRPALPIQFHILGLKWQNWTIATPFLLQKLLEWTISHNLKEEYTRSLLLSNFTKEQIDRIIPNGKQNWAFDSVPTIKDEDIPQKYQNKHYQQTAKLDPIPIKEIISLGLPEFFISAEGSNAWVVSGQHTESGKPLLSADPHLDSALPSHWYQIRASYHQQNKSVQFAGVSVPGIPTAYGKNQYFASAMTVIYSDTQDLFREQIKENKYLVDGQWRELGTRQEVILVKTEKGMTEYHHKVRMTHRGPILNYIVCQFGTYELKEPLSLSWTGYNHDYASVVACSRSIQIDNFQDAMLQFADQTSHFLSLSMLVATADNHIIYQQSGLNPIRRNYAAGSYVKDGTTSQHDWLGIMPAPDRLSVIDPKCGYIVTCNNKPASDIFQNGYFSQSIYTARADRLEKLLKDEIASGRKITNDFAKKTLYDTVDIYCQQILQKILGTLPQSQAKLSDFDCDFKPTSAKATIYEVFMWKVWKEITPFSENNFSHVSLHNFQQSAYKCIQRAYEGSAGDRIVVERAWTAMEQELKDRFQTEDQKKWVWGELHRDVTMQLPLGAHPLLGKLYNRETAGWGNFHTPNIGKANKLQMGNFNTAHRANLRTVYDFGGPSWWVLDSGSSQNPLSPYYSDQWTLLTSNQLLPVWPLPSEQGKPY